MQSWWVIWGFSIDQNRLFCLKCIHLNMEMDLITVFKRLKHIGLSSIFPNSKYSTSHHYCQIWTVMFTKIATKPQSKYIVNFPPAYTLAYIYTEYYLCMNFHWDRLTSHFETGSARMSLTFFLLVFWLMRCSRLGIKYILFI